MTEETATPDQIGRYRVEQRLAQGGMGEVYRGYDTQLERPVALKRILPSEARHETAVRRFRREARAVARLGHSTIVQLFDWLEEADSHWIVMEWIDGPTLREVLKRGPLPWDIAARIGCDIARGLAVAHGVGIVHRDLKSANIMITAHDEVRIMDFGLAKQVGASKYTPLSAVSEQGIVIGTVSAMSPEQAQGHPVDHRSDLFSFGSLLYQLLTGIKPFRADSSVKVLVRICSDTPSPVREWMPDIPEALSDLVAQLLEKAPEDRPADAHEVATKLEEFAAPLSAIRGLSQLGSAPVADADAADRPPDRAPDSAGRGAAGPDSAAGTESVAARSVSLHDGPMTADYGSYELDPRLDVTAGLANVRGANEWTRPRDIRAPAPAEPDVKPDDDTSPRDDPGPD